MKLIVGLGNPGKKYARTRHNIGFLCLEAYATKHILTFKFDNKFNGEWVKHGDTILLKPHTFMNLSGQSVQAMMNYFNIDPEDILVIYDDLDLPTAKLRLRMKGSAGGHNGIKSIIQSIGTQSFNRVRFGISKPTRRETKDYVLSTFSKAEGDEVIQSIDVVTEIIEGFSQGHHFNKLMNQYN